MRIRYSVLVLLATLGCILAQEQNSTPQEIQLTKPKPDYFALPQFRPLRPFVTQDELAPQEAPLARPRFDFKFPLFGSLRRSQAQNRLMRPTLRVVPDGRDLQSQTPP